MTKQWVKLKGADRYRYFLVPVDIKIFTNMFDEYDNLYKAINLWCIKNCEGKWSWIETTMWGFELEEEAMAFKLRWS